ncbi:hypothetical protein RFI_03870 [Reticulomyxa filosa]|uniref:USP domain-containing protein n=1 Tax=Reticulomyxa filosa TaxID=46433 RepID=X6P6J2_RETFI|nr:hypothetical protein RFI_03870 [Reticulomyxa filosa]|eukprot:ETO33237.1 hypothetical protein RFI_03870 [Reticulomyxa filosa]
MLQPAVNNLDENKDPKVVKCYDKGWIQWCKLELLEIDICFECKQVVKDAMRLTCEQRKRGEVLIIGKECLIKYMKENNGKYPSNKAHIDCNYKCVKSELVQERINQFKVKCPRQYQQLQARLNEKSTMTDSNPGCQYKGKIEDIQEHLEKSCPLSPIDCPFRQYGCKDIILRCNTKRHLDEMTKHHLNLVQNKFSAYEKKIEELKTRHQEEIKLLQVLFLFVCVLVEDGMMKFVFQLKIKSETKKKELEIELKILKMKGDINGMIHFVLFFFKKNRKLESEKSRSQQLEQKTKEYETLPKQKQGPKEKEQTEETKETEKKIPKGLKNLGNACYINASLQCLINTPLLQQLTLNEQSIKLKSNKMFIQFQQLMEGYWQINTNSREYVVAPSGVKSALGQLIPKFQTFDQQDTLECLLLLLSFDNEYYICNIL